MHLFHVILTSSLISLGYTFNYGELGPDTWPYLIERTCGDTFQSPIDIDESETTYLNTLRAFEFINYDQSLIWNITNNGNGVVLTPSKTNRTMAIGGSDFAQAFDLLQFHFHWGENDFQGSEHTVNGRKYPLELHFVHASPAGALKVLGFLFELSPVDNPNLNDMLNGISRAVNRSLSQQVLFNPFSILPSNLTVYYRYAGSLTTPPCTEGVIWSVFRSTIRISSRQLVTFRKTTNDKNFRPVQPINRRTIYSSVQRDLSSSCSMIWFNYALVLACFTTLFF